MTTASPLIVCEPSIVKVSVSGSEARCVRRFDQERRAEEEEAVGRRVGLRGLLNGHLSGAPLGSVMPATTGSDGVAPAAEVNGPVLPVSSTSTA